MHIYSLYNILMGENEEMSDFVLSCCSTADLSKEHFEAIDVKYICFHFELDGVPYLDDLGQSMPFDEFYEKMAAGAETKTSQINADEFAGYFRPFLEQGLDVLHVCLSSGITGVINSANIAKGILAEEFPNRKIYIVDSLGASSGYGLIMDGTHIYTSTKSTTNDEMRKFIEHIIDPLIDFISEHLRMCYDRKVREEGKNQPNLVNGITANYSTIVVANSIEGNISNNVDISEEVKNDAIDLINSIKEIISVDGNEAEEGILEVLKQIELDINANNKPKKGFLVALKSICGGSAAVITLINSLMKLLGFA